ncbi:MAG: CocE/NonD family hydrolase [Myxococcota bacterium]|jgi:hypothetical protein
MKGKGIIAVLFLAILAGSTVAHALPTMTEMVAMPDGVKLATDVYFPASGGSGPWPVILIRTNYGRKDFATFAEDFRAQGPVAVVLQDTRGRFDSEGVNCVFKCDRQDGLDTVQWLRKQSWATGDYCLWGISALGIDAHLLASASPEGLKCIWTHVATANLYDFIFTNGSMRYGDVENWISGFGDVSFLDLIKENPLLDSFWESGQSSQRYDQVKVPGVHVAGWYDMFTQNSIDTFAGYNEKGGEGARGNQKLIVGPWTHVGNIMTIQGELTYTDDSTFDFTESGKMFMKFAMHHLGVKPDPDFIAGMPTARYYAMGDVKSSKAPGNTWKSSDVWPPASKEVNFYLTSSGTLDEKIPATETTTVYTYDPTDPSPTKGGGNLSLSNGPVDQSAVVESRGDVRIFNKAISKPLEITGNVYGHFWVSIDQPDTDISIRLTDVYPDGKSMLITDTSYRLASRGVQDKITPVTPGEVVEAVIRLPATSIILNKGHKLRAVVSSSNYPRFWRNPNDGTNYRDPNASPRPVNVTIYQDPARPSHLVLPVVGDTSEGTDGGVNNNAAGSAGGGCSCSMVSVLN